MKADWLIEQKALSWIKKNRAMKYENAISQGFASILTLTPFFLF